MKSKSTSMKEKMINYIRNEQPTSNRFFICFIIIYYLSSTYKYLSYNLNYPSSSLHSLTLLPYSLSLSDSPLYFHSYTPLFSSHLFTSPLISTLYSPTINLSPPLFTLSFLATSVQMISLGKDTETCRIFSQWAMMMKVFHHPSITSLHYYVTILLHNVSASCNQTSLFRIQNNIPYGLLLSSDILINS